jgi:hypothetical protein
MDLIYRVKYVTRKTMLHVMGPAALDHHNDPIKRMEREWEERFGPRIAKLHVTPARKRRFTPGLYEAA